jgi:hypothetical protein
MVVLEGELVKEMLALIPGEMELFEMLSNHLERRRVL